MFRSKAEQSEVTGASERRTGSIRKRLAALALASMVGVCTILGTAAPAQAQSETTFCGQEINDDTFSPATNPTAALNTLSTAFYDEKIEWLAGQTGTGPEICVPAHAAIEMMAGKVVGAVLGRGGMTYIKVHNIINSGLPDRLPDVGPSAQGTVFATGGRGLWLRGGPTVGSPGLTVVPEGTPLSISCQTYGTPINNGQATTALWDKVTFHNGEGYVSDAYVFTGTYGQVAPTC